MAGEDDDDDDDEDEDMTTTKFSGDHSNYDRL